ncbi:hypothetical protein [Listeria valentina]|uniref:hypothetical protein n=1 Tax=Listeria valentina TaxID=2705293 RepID=UPI00142F5070|nr:hypothetical protein [Listeria valentina]
MKKYWKNGGLFFLFLIYGFALALIMGGRMITWKQLLSQIVTVLLTIIGAVLLFLLKKEDTDQQGNQFNHHYREERNAFSYRFFTMVFFVLVPLLLFVLNLGGTFTIQTKIIARFLFLAFLAFLFFIYCLKKQKGA